MSTLCDLCDGSSFEQVYAANGVSKKQSVWLCTHCGLLQNLQRSQRRAHPLAAPPSDAERESSHQIKAARAEFNLAKLKPFLPKNKPLRVLDTGAGRGAFAIELKSVHPAARVIAVESDARAASAWSGSPGFTWLNARLEDTRLEAEGFDLVYACHTLQHLTSARDALLTHRMALAPDGYLLIDVPNLAKLSRPDAIEEFFTDGHRYHFSARTLTRLLATCGLRVIAAPDPRDNANITVIAVKSDATPIQAEADPREVEAAASLVSSYHASRMRNLAALSAVARAIGEMAPRKVALWGAGRLLHNLIASGGLRPQTLAAIVDSNFTRASTTASGLRLTPPAELGRVNPGIVVVMSRDFTNTIHEQARIQAPDSEIIAYSDLLARTTARAA
jgi:2-polyprenyl-3-methyl-5-hydroxy-6-metoxy-1,4-benzoquinol methylase